MVNKREIGFWAIIVSASLYLMYFYLPFPDIDDMVFKLVSLNFIKYGKFTAPGLIGYLPSLDKGFAWYPPLYPLLYATWFKVFGFSLLSEHMLFFIICGLLVYLQCLLYKQNNNNKIPLYIFTIIFFCWTLALDAVSRPDTLFAALALLLLFYTDKIGERLGLKEKITICILLALSLATSLALGLLLSVYMLFLSASQDKAWYKNFRERIFLFTSAIFLSMVIWLSVLHFEVSLFIKQTLPFFANHLYEFYKLTLTHPWPSIRRYIRYEHLLFHFPLMVYLFFVALKYRFHEREQFKKRKLSLRIIGASVILIFLAFPFALRPAYCRVFFTIFASSIIFLIPQAFFERKAWVKPCLYLFLSISLLPFIRENLSLPLTWKKQDTYGYNRKLILNKIPLGTKVITDPMFWYILGENYEVFDLNFSRPLADADYILASGVGSGEPDMASLDFNKKENDYFLKNYIKYFSTLAMDPNTILGVPISRSRWSYRFEIYKHTRAPGPNLR